MKAGLYHVGMSAQFDSFRVEASTFVNVHSDGGVVLAAQGEFWARERVFVCEKPWRVVDLFRWLFALAPLPSFKPPRIEWRPAFCEPWASLDDATRDAERRQRLRAERRRRIEAREETWAS